MDLRDSPEEAAYRSKVRNWLSENAAEYSEPPAVPWSEEELLNRARRWQKTKAEAGFEGITWSKEVGGQGGTEIESVIFKDEENQYHTPSIALLRIGNNMGIPTIAKHGRADQLEQFAGPTLRGDIGWCQLFSEPGAGSDLAAVRTRAVRDGDNWIVNGQKVWSSWAHHADWGLLLARTDPTVPKHKGLTFFLLDMKRAGIEIRPIEQIDGNAEFNEAFLTDVVIPDSARVGEVGKGWGVAMTLLTSERISTAGTGGLARRMLEKAASSARGEGKTALDSSVVRSRIAECHIREQGQKYFRARILTQLSKGNLPGAEAALIKLVFSKNLQRASAQTMDIDGYSGLVEGAEAPENRAIHEDFVWASAMRIAGGADEVLRNQIAERVLGMPGEPRSDKDVPFDQLNAN